MFGFAYLTLGALFPGLKLPRQRREVITADLGGQGPCQLIARCTVTEGQPSSPPRPN